MMNKLVLWLLIPAIAMGSWGAPTAGADSDVDALQGVSTTGELPVMAQVEATPVVTEPEAPAPASSDPASTSPAKDSGTTTVAPADFPNVCDGSDPTKLPVTFTVQFPGGMDNPPIQVTIFPENNGCIPGVGYSLGPLTFGGKQPTQQQVDLPAGRYVYEYSGDGFEPKSHVPFQVDGIEDNVTINPGLIPAAEPVTLNVTIPAGGSSMTIVISDQSGVVESFVATEAGTTEFRTKLPARGLDYDYYYEYWGDDYPWSDRQPFQVEAGTPEVITIAPVIATITLDPQQAPAETSVRVRVTGFRANDEYELNFNNGQIVQYGRADINGEISTTFTVPNGLAPGKYPVVVTGAVSGQRVEATFTVEEAAQLIVDPASGPAGNVVTVSGSGFLPEQVVTIRFGGATGQIVGYRPANQDGTFSGRITIPKTAAVDDYQVVASQEGGPSATAKFTVTERIVKVTVSPTSVAPGTVVTVTGIGYAPKEMVDIYWVDTDGPRLGYVTADSSGSFTGRVTVPRTAGTGSYPIQVRGRTSGATGSATVSVTAPTPQVTVSPASQTSGKVVRVSGSGFLPDERVDIRWNDANGSLLGYVTASSSGTVSGAVTVPAGTVPGSYRIYTIGKQSDRSGSANLTVTGATVTMTPTTASPGTVVTVSGSGFGANERVDIRWNDASGRLLGYRTTTSGGAMSGKVTIPADAAPGTYTLHLQGQTSGIVGSVTMTVPDPASTHEPGIAWRPGYGGEGMVGTYGVRPTA